MNNRLRAGLSLALLMLAAGGCSTRFDHLGKPPSMTAPGKPRKTLPPTDPMAIALRAHAQPRPEEEESGIGSLWRSGPESLFGDRRARTVGDLVTVVVGIDERAEIRNRTDRNRIGNENISSPALLGAGALAANALPGGAGLDPAIEVNSRALTSGDGRIQREERITLRLAATVQDVLPNGHLMIFGDQEIRVNNELRDLQVAGIIRPEDISRQNVITYDKIASARVVYGGRGQLMDIQQPRWGQQVIDAVSPF